MSPHAFFSLFLGFQVHVQYVPMRCSGAWRDLHDWLCSTLCTRGQLDHWAMPQRQQHSASWHIVLLPALFCSLELFSFFLNMLNNWKMLYDCYWLVPVNSLKSSQQNSQIKASFFCLETWVSLFIAAQTQGQNGDVEWANLHLSRAGCTAGLCSGRSSDLPFGVGHLLPLIPMFRFLHGFLKFARRV